jgi:uncharacterized zinc-type alcohol dehydrogenase-like protein
MRDVAAYATPGPKRPFERVLIQRRDLRPRDVLIKIAFAGICHSDIHTGHGDWGEAIYPLVPGHEIAGTVEALGTEAQKFAVGDRVGVGCMVDSCRRCTSCESGEEQYCLEGMVGTYNAIGSDGLPTVGGYSTHIVVDEDFVVSIPDGIGLDVAAPLLCAGITLYSPLLRWNAGPGKEVAIVGLGGLGHMGVKIARAMGAEVTVLSRSPSKQQDAERLGAHHFHVTGDATTFEPLKERFDLIVNTVSAPLPIDSYLSLLRLDGVMVNVGAPPDPLEDMHVLPLLMRRRSFAGSAIGGIRETQEMLDFCAAHNLGADIEVIGGEEIDAAWERVLDSDVRYRFVIDTATF